MESRTIKITPSAKKHGNLNISSCGREFFPEDVFGTSCRADGIGVPITLKVEGLPNPVKTDIPRNKNSRRPRWLFRERAWVKEFVQFHKLSPGDMVTIDRLEKNTYLITPAKHTPQPDLFQHRLQPVLYAQKLAEQYIDSTRSEYRKEKGQYFTPPEVAKFIAKLGTSLKHPPVRILDPGAGSGILSCAVCEQLANKYGVKKIEIDTYENDSDLLQFLYRALNHTSQWLKERAIHLKFNIINEDFVLSASDAIGTQKYCLYDLVVSNPPYSKISANDRRAQAFSEVVYGQPNIYTLFMAASIKLLKDSGLMVFITPRSYTTGHYFKAFRKVFFAEMNPVRAHLFESRKHVFSKQSVLQENLILKAQKRVRHQTITLSSSQDVSNLDSCTQNKVPLSYALLKRKKDIIFRLPLDGFDDLVIDIVDSWTATLGDYNLQISTGPVVPFRAKKFIQTNDLSKETLVPLLWMRNVQPMKVIWPFNGQNNRKASCYQFITNNFTTRNNKLIVPNKNVVLLRRFSAKEEKRRLIAAPLFKEQLNFEFIGIENHLNYIYRRKSDIACDEAQGLAALLNSTLLDRYFRICNGNTQVSATEIRTMPLPPLKLIKKLGSQLDLKQA